MSTKFAKLYETEIGQVLAMIQAGQDEDDGQEIRFFAQPDGLGVCSVSIGFPDTDEGRDKAESFFGAVDEGMALKMGREIFKTAAQFTSA